MLLPNWCQKPSRYRLLSIQIAQKLSRLGSLGQMVPVNSSPSSLSAISSML